MNEEIWVMQRYRSFLGVCICFADFMLMTPKVGLDGYHLWLVSEAKHVLVMLRF